MKKLKLILIATIVGINLNAQNWLEGSPSWSFGYYCFNPFDITEGYDNFRFIKDTVIDNTSMKKFSHEIKRRTINIGPDNETWHFFRDEYFYELDNKIWQYWPPNGTVASRHDLMYDYSFTTGDTLDVTYGGEFCGDSLYFIIDSVGFLNVGGYDLAFQDVVVRDSLDTFEGQTMRFIEKIGPFHYDFRSNYSCLLDVCGSPVFSCYENEELDLYFPEGSTCDRLANVPKLTAESLTIFPNPSNGSFTLQNIKGGEMIEILDIAGSSISFQRIGENMISFDGPAGIYIVKVITKDGKLRIGRIVKN